VKKQTIEIGPGVACHLDTLVNTRLLVQANSGAGKSWLLRRLLEQSHGQVQHLVIDPEGEFASLRTRFDYVLAARSGGDTSVDPRVAKLLARRLLELGASAILDIYELNPSERVRFVRYFLEALVDAPKELWHPALVVIDEAHVYCPEKGEAESADAVKALCARGRKRGFCAVLATQRLSKLAKDAAAETNNKLIGRASLDVDLERAGDELGMSKADRQGLRQLEAGEFYAFGPALSRAVVRVQVGPVLTEHPKAGSKLAGVVPPPSDKVRAMLPKLSDLPAEVEAHEQSVATLRKQIADLKRQLVNNDAAMVAAYGKRETVEKRVLTDADRALLADLARKLADHAKRSAEAVTAAESRLEQRVTSAVAEYLQTIRNVSTEIAEKAATTLDRAGLQKVIAKLEGVAVAAPARAVATPVPKVTPSSPVPQARGQQPPRASDGGLPGVQQKILNALAELEQLGAAQPDRELVALLAGYTNLTSKGFSNGMGALRSGGYIDYPTQGTIALTESGRAAAVPPPTPRSSAEIQQRVISLLGGASARILQPLIEAYPKSLPREHVAAAAGYGNLTSKGFSNAVGRLRSLGFIDYPDRGTIVANPVLFIG
jgi:uncharacterized protein